MTKFCVYFEDHNSEMNWHESCFSCMNTPAFHCRFSRSCFRTKKLVGCVSLWAGENDKNWLKSFTKGSKSSRHFSLQLQHNAHIWKAMFATAQVKLQEQWYFRTVDHLCRVTTLGASQNIRNLNVKAVTFSEDKFHFWSATYTIAGAAVLSRLQREAICINRTTVVERNANYASQQNVFLSHKFWKAYLLLRERFSSEMFESFN